jgi:hypothetical protein
MELLFPDGQPGIQVDAGVRLQGGTSRELNKSHKNSLRLLFKGDYGPSQLEFPVFPDSPVRRFDTLVLDSWLNYVWHYRGGSSPAEQRRRAQYVRTSMWRICRLRLGQHRRMAVTFICI